VKKKGVSEVLRKYDVCVKYDDVSDTNMPKHNFTNLEAVISWAYIGTETETLVK
jgi:hypothetical protein